MHSLHIPFTVFVALALVVSSHPLAHKDVLAARAVKGAHLPEYGAGSPMDLTSKEPSAPSLNPVLSGGLPEEKREGFTLLDRLFGNALPSGVNPVVPKQEDRLPGNRLLSGPVGAIPIDGLDVTPQVSGDSLPMGMVGRAVATLDQTKSNLGKDVSQFDATGSGSVGGVALNRVDKLKKDTGNKIGTGAGMDNSPVHPVVGAVVQAVENILTGATKSGEGVVNSATGPSLP